MTRGALVPVMSHLTSSLVLACFTFAACSASGEQQRVLDRPTKQHIAIDLEQQHPRLSSTGSPRGFPAHVHAFERVNQNWLSSVSRFSKLSSTKLPPQSFTSRRVSVDLLGGITKVGEYYTRVFIGGQPIRVQVDTGSSTMALPVAECDRCLPSDQRYNPRLSNTKDKQRWVKCTNDLCKRNVCTILGCKECSADGACCADENPSACAFSLHYGDNSLARGGLMVDVMTWGNVSASVVFGAILHDSQDFERPLVDGILGMGYESLACNPTCVEPPFQQMVKAGVVEDSFSICITRQGGKLILGSFDRSLAKADPIYVPLALTTPPKFYTMNVSQTVTLGKRSIAVPNLRAGILDSGTTLVVISKTFFRLLLSHLMEFYCDVPGLCHTDRPWFMPSACVKLTDEEIDKLPTLTFQLGPKKEFNLELRAQDYMLHMQKAGATEYRCVGIMAMEMGGEQDIIFGNTVMQRYVTHYDRKNKRLGFAEAVEGCGGAARCSSYTQCNECATTEGCSYDFRGGGVCREKRTGVGIVPFPECSGSLCMCWLGPQKGLVFGMAAGFLGSLLVIFVSAFVVGLYSRRGIGGGDSPTGRAGDEPTYAIDDDEDGTYLPPDQEASKDYRPVPSAD